MSERGCEAVGIDLGTTFSSLAYLDKHLVPLIVQDGSGQSVIPSVIYFDEGGAPLVGDIAVQQSKVHAHRVVQFIKTHMGEKWTREIDGQTHTPESLSAIILAHLLREAEPQIGPVKSAVITVPAFFTEKRRRATQQAGEIAGLTVIGTLNEPAAAALAYGLHRQKVEQLALIYDLGGGTFDVTIVRITPNEVEEMATDGNRRLGGRDWDKCLMELALEDFKKAKKITSRRDEESAQVKQELQDLRIECERAKRQLSRVVRTQIRMRMAGQDHVVTVTREQFEQATAHLLQLTRLTTQKVLKDAGKTWGQISRVVLVGGSTHMPMVRQMLQEVSGKAPDAGLNPVTAVALGAAIYARILESGEGPRAVEQEVRQDTVNAAPPPVNPKVSFVTAHGVGVGTRTQNVVLIPKNTKVPAENSQRFYTHKKVGSKADKIRIVMTQGDTTSLELAEVIGTAAITGIPANEPDGQPVDIKVHFDQQGRLHFRAVYANTGQKLQTTLEIPDGLRQEEVEWYHKYMVETGLIDPAAAGKLAAGSRRGADEDEEDAPVLEPI